MNSTVADVYQAAFNRIPPSEFEDVPVCTVVGRACFAQISAALTLIDGIKNRGGNRLFEDALATTVSESCLVYICG